MNSSLCHCCIYVTELGLAWYTRQISSLLNTTTLVEFTRAGSWNSLQEVKLAVIHMTHSIETSLRCQRLNRHKYPSTITDMVDYDFRVQTR